MKLWWLLALLITGCSERHISRPSPDITFQGDRLIYGGKRFSGVVELRIPEVQVVRYTHYRDGQPHGREEETFADGRVVARREFSRGRKVGVHEGWYPSGHRRFHYEYTDDQYDGESWEWYDSGALSLYALFEAGRLVGKKQWRADGTIFQNYVFPQGKAVGLPGAKLCFQVRKPKT